MDQHSIHKALAYETRKSSNLTKTQTRSLKIKQNNMLEKTWVIGCTKVCSI